MRIGRGMGMLGGVMLAQRVEVAAAVLIFSRTFVEFCFFILSFFSWCFSFLFSSHGITDVIWPFFFFLFFFIYIFNPCPVIT